MRVFATIPVSLLADFARYTGWIRAVQNKNVKQVLCELLCNSSILYSVFYCYYLDNNFFVKSLFACESTIKMSISTFYLFTKWYNQLTRKIKVEGCPILKDTDKSGYHCEVIITRDYFAWHTVKTILFKVPPRKLCYLHTIWNKLRVSFSAKNIIFQLVFDENIVIFWVKGALLLS